jgi:hypothetical protein
MENVTHSCREQRKCIRFALACVFFLAGFVSVAIFFIAGFADLSSGQITALPVQATVYVFCVTAAAGILAATYGLMLGATCFALIFIPTARIVIAPNFVRIIQKIQEFHQRIYPAPISTGRIIALAATCLAVLAIQHATPHLLFSLTNSLIFYS